MTNSRGPRRERPLVEADFEGWAGLSRAARADLLARQPATVREALAVTGVGRKTTAHLLELGLITDPDGVQHPRPRERPLRASGHLEQPRQETDRCTRCAKEIRGFETISVTGKGEFCYPCFNEDVAARVGVQFDNAQLEPVTLHDLAAKPHTFRIRSMLVATGHEMEAIEIQGGRPRGYHFRVLGDFAEDAMVHFAKLYRRMREGLATKHVQHGQFGWRLTKGQRLTARIEVDLESDQRLPILVIDGKEFSWSQVGHMLMTFEGFTVDMLVRDTIEVVGGPLLEEAKAKTES